MRVHRVKLSMALALCAGCGGIVLDEASPPPPPPDASPPVKDAAAYVDTSVPDASAPPPPDAEADPKMVLVGNIQPTSFAVDDSWVYWTDFSRKVMKVSVQGGTPVVLATQQANPVGIAIDATNVYWSNFGLQTPHTAAIMSIPIGGGTPVQLAECPSFCGDVTADASHLYWVSDGVNVVRAGLDGSNAQTIATETNPVHRIVVQDNLVYWSTGQDFQMNHVERAALDGTARVNIASEYGIIDIAAIGADIFFISSVGGSGALDHVNSWAPGQVKTLAAGAGGGYAGPVAVDESYVYFSWFGGDGFMKMPILGGSPVHVTIKVNGYYESTNGIVAHGANLYWLGMTGGSATSINVTPK